MPKSKKAVKRAVKTAYDPSQSPIVQIGVAFIVVAAIFIVALAVKQMP